ncbi:FtsW/RodA/SpoVE family cell cycle protein [bacterium]|nr:FtsW/RodA/SpoVE family cell cycle protein [candidate division CSSED10-310 bacterium]
MNSTLHMWSPISLTRHAAVVFKSSNPFIALIVMALTGIGLLGIFTSGRHLHPDPYYYFHHQLIHVGIGFIFLVLLALVDYSYFRFKTQLPYFGTILLLVAVLLFGNQSWLAFPFFNIQPSELGKLVLILYISCSMAFDRIDSMRFFADSLPILIGCISLIGPTAAQPDFGTALIMTIITGYMLLSTGFPFLHLAIPAIPVIPVVVIVPFIYPYVMVRFTNFLVNLNPFSSPSQLSFHDYHMRMAMGNGGFWGTGFGNGLVKRSFLPASHTDSIFTVLVEEGGFLMGIGIVALFLGLIWMGELTARAAKDRFGAFLARGITCYFGAQAFLNIGVCLGILPNTGVTLPFLSYGGSSMVISMAAIGILINVSSQRQMII